MKKYLSLLAFGLAEIASAQLSSSLTACYSLNNNATDAISGLTGTMSSVVTATVDRNNNSQSALSFSVEGNGITLPEDARIKSNELTFSAWVKAVNTGASQYILFTKNTASGNFEAYFLVFNASGMFVAGKGNNGTVANAYSTNTFVSNTWHHVAFSFDNARVKLYVDGNLEANTTSTLAVGYESGKNVIIGGSGESFNLPFTGCLDNVRFYNRMLSDSEIMQLFNQDPSCVNASGLSKTENKPVIKIYPNPSSGIFKLTYNQSGAARLLVGDWMGNSLINKSIEGGEETIVDLRDFANGIYFVAVTINETREIIKLVKE